MHISDRQDIEIALFVEALKRRHGYDFSGYAPASFKRRVLSLQQAHNLDTISALTAKLVHEEEFLPLALEKLTVPVSEFFREPPLWRALREQVLPRLATFPHLNIWQAGCAHGEEVYSLAILLSEAGLYERARIFATDISEAALHQAQEGIYPEAERQLYADNYRAAGGARDFSDYCTAAYGRVKLDERLKRNVTFGAHNLVSDGIFGEMQLILCRNVLIYFGGALQDHALGLFRDSLTRGGYLVLGQGESVSASSAVGDFIRLREGLPLYQRAAGA